MEKFPKSVAEDNSIEKKGHYSEYIAPMLILIDELRRNRPAAHKLLDGDKLYWDLEETAISNSDEEGARLQSALVALSAFHKTAIELPNLETDALRQLDARFYEKLYGAIKP